MILPVDFLDAPFLTIIDVNIARVAVVAVIFVVIVLRPIGIRAPGAGCILADVGLTRV